MSHPFLMNDDEELRWGIVEGVKRVSSSQVLAASFGSEVHFAAFLNAVEEEMDLDGRTNSFDTYVACFCKHDVGDADGLLSMWRAYGANGSGVAVVFNTATLVGDDDSPLIIAPVSYRSTEERYAWMDRMLGWCAQTVAGLGPDVSEDVIRQVATAYFKRLRYFALFTKHAAFSEEREWRVVYFPDMDDGDRYKEMMSYAITPKGIQPKLKLRLGERAVGRPLHLEEAVASILLGPTAGTLLSVHALKRMLEILGKGRLTDRVQFSSTPYRP